jgi:hypothetical protein
MADDSGAHLRTVVKRIVKVGEIFVVGPRYLRYGGRESGDREVRRALERYGCEEGAEAWAGSP